MGYAQETAKTSIKSAEFQLYWVVILKLIFRNKKTIRRTYTLMSLYGVRIHCIPLTVLIRPHLGYVAALRESYFSNLWFTRGTPKNDLALIFGAPGSKCRYASFSFRLDFWVCEDLVTWRTHRVLLIRIELSQDKFAWWTAFESSNSYYKIVSDIFPSRNR